MSDINWAGVRQTAYAILAGALTASAGIGWITADDVTAITDNVDTIFNSIGAIAFTLAAGNTHPERHVPKRKPAADEGLPVYDGPTSAPDYVGKHRATT